MEAVKHVDKASFSLLRVHGKPRSQRRRPLLLREKSPAAVNPLTGLFNALLLGADFFLII